MSSQTLCKFYAQGTCKFGNTCRYSHSGGSPAYHHGGGGTYPNQDPTKKLMENVGAALNTLIADMKEWEAGKIWNFSSYSPLGSRASIPGFEDLSEDELRWSVVETGNLPPDFQERVNKVNQLRMYYAQPTPENQNLVRELLSRSLQSPPTFGVYPYPHTFSGSSQSQPQAANIFGGGTQASSFPNMSNSSGIFGGSGGLGQQSGAIFGGGGVQSQQHTNIFGGGAQPTDPARIFGGASSQLQQSMSSFGGNSSPIQQSMSTFGGTSAPIQQSMSAFGGTSSPLQQPLGMFGGTNSALQQPSSTIFGGTPSTGIFGGGTGIGQIQAPTPQMQPNITSWGGNSTTFGQSQAMIAPLSQQQGQTVFGGGLATSMPQQQQAQTLFGGGLASSTPPHQQQAQTVFGGVFAASTAPHQQQAQTVFGGGLATPMSPQQGFQTFGSTIQNQPTVVFGGGSHTSSGTSPLTPKFSIKPQREYINYTEDVILNPEDMKSFEEQELTDHVPIVSPPRKYCIH